MEMNKMYQGKGHMLDIYAMDDNKNLYKVFSENYVRDVDEEWCIYNIAGNEFIYTWDFAEGEHIDGVVSTWPVPSFEELQTYLHCEKTGESRNCDSEALSRVNRILKANNIRCIKPIGFFAVGVRYFYCPAEDTFYDAITIVSPTDIIHKDDDLSLGEFLHIGGIEGVPKSILQKLYDFFVQPPTQTQEQ